MDKQITIDDILAHLDRGREINSFLDAFGRKVAVIQGVKDHPQPFIIHPKFAFNDYRYHKPEMVDELDEWEIPTGEKVPVGPATIEISYYWSWNGGGDSKTVEFPVDWLGNDEHLSAKAEAAKARLLEEAERKKAREQRRQEDRDRAEYERLRAKFEQQGT